MIPSYSPSLVQKGITPLPIHKVVVPVAGLGTRLLPTTRALPKEMLPVGRIPVIQHVVEEMADAGLDRVLFVTSRLKTIIENQFDNTTGLIRHLGESGRLEDLGDFDYRQRGIEFFYARQQAVPGATAPGGTGEAILTGESFVGDEPFVVAYGDTIIRSERSPSLVDRMVQAHTESDALVTIAVRTVPEDATHLYGIVQPADGADPAQGIFPISGIVEKPSAGSAPTTLAVSARYVYSPEIFDSIRAVNDEDAEQGITSAIRHILRQGHRVQCVSLEEGEHRYDIGNHESYYKAFIDYALSDPECGQAIRDHIQRKATS